MSEYDPSELTTLHFAAHDALGVLLRAQGFTAGPHWLCCSREAKAKGIGYVYGSMMAKSIKHDDVVPYIERSMVSEPAFAEWKAREVAAAESRGETPIEPDEDDEDDE